MGSSFSHPNVFLGLMCFLSAGFYVAATMVMKLMGHQPFALLLVPILLTFGTAAWFEVMVLRDGRLGQVFLLIFAFEVVMTALFAIAFLRETYSTREIAGLVVIVTGIGMMLYGGPAPQAKDPALPEPRITATLP